MKKLLFIFIVLITISNTYAQEPNLSFPDDFLGIYKGELHITSLKGFQEIPMEFHLLKTDIKGKYHYKIVYNNAPRNYYLIIKDKEKGVFEIDEANGIVLPAHFNDNVLYSFFEVQGNFLTTRLDFGARDLLFEILFSKLANRTTTGGILNDKDSTDVVPKVYGFPISVFQKAILKKQ